MEKQETMLGRIVMMLVTVPAEMLGTLAALIEKLVSHAGLETLEALKRFLRKEETCWGLGELLEVTRRGYLKRSPILPRLLSISVDPNGYSNRLRSRITPVFTERFMGKMESSYPPNGVHSYDIVIPAIASTLLADLGGEQKAMLFLIHIEAMIDRQSSGGDGLLAVDGTDNSFFVRDLLDRLCLVTARYRESEWHLGCYDLGAHHVISGRVFTHSPVRRGD